MLRFDDARLDDTELVLGDTGQPLRHLALAGARLRQALGLADFAALSAVADGVTPRAIVAVGPEARLIRAVAEPVCPVPLVAWAPPGLPAWVGALDLVVFVSGDRAADGATMADAIRRGALVLVISAGSGAVTEHAVGRSVAALATGTDDAFVSATIGLASLARLGFAPAVNPERVADGLDQVAAACSPQAPLGRNPAKDTAVSLADAIPLVWGGPVLAARAARRIAEAIRQVSHRAALAADAAELWPVLRGCRPPDVFADPFFDPADDLTYCLVRLDDGCPEPGRGAAGDQLEQVAEAHGVRVARIRYDEGTALERYACLLQHGRFAAAYLGLGLV
ncbi:MAG: hypothetical protein LBH76_00870 [Propionibacteriaceae bacterium]|jgi:hypothetical protein|nr:hypothetical protein [Propionibacteriaceae bacterium]